MINNERKTSAEIEQLYSSLYYSRNHSYRTTALKNHAIEILKEREYNESPNEYSYNYDDDNILVRTK